MILLLVVFCCAVALGASLGGWLGAGIGAAAIVLPAYLLSKAGERAIAAKSRTPPSEEQWSVPAELRPPTPRPDVWAEREETRGYGDLLLHGTVTWGYLWTFRIHHDSEGPDIDLRYTWSDAAGVLHEYEFHDSYDAMHASMSGRFEHPLVSCGVPFRSGQYLTIVYEPGTSMHVVYEIFEGRRAQRLGAQG